MDPLSQKLIEHLRSITLSDTERATMRTALVRHMRERSAPHGVRSPWSWLLHTRHAHVAFLSLIIVLGYGSSVTLATEGALPGDMLYPVKTRMIEPVTRLMTATSPAAKATFETQLLEKRLLEVETLDAEKKLNPELTQAVRKVIREQSIKAKEKINDSENDSQNVPDVRTVTSVTVTGTSTPESNSGQNRRRSSSIDNDNKKESDTKHALQTVLKKHERILEKLDLDDDDRKDDTEDEN